MTDPPRLRALPDHETLRALSALLRRDGYAQIQYVPFAAHDPGFVSDNLESVVNEELRTLAAVKMGEPVVYSHSISPDHYSSGLNPRQRLLTDLFLHNRAVGAQRLRALAVDYEAFVHDSGQGQFISALRIVPVFELLLAADPLEANDDRRIFLHNDSVQMARFLQRERPCTGRVVADVGTGSGLLAAIAATQGARRVVAVDINPRALEFARASFVMNGLVSIELRQGSIADVVDEAELVISNPPYMTRPGALCLDGGGDDGLEIAREFVRCATMRGRRLLMLLESDSRVGAPRLEAMPTRAVVLRSFAGRELAVYDFCAKSEGGATEAPRHA